MRIFAANNVRFTCEDGSHVQQSGAKWGDWTAEKKCPAGSLICGLKTAVEGKMGGGDDTALNEIMFYCCSE